MSSLSITLLGPFAIHVNDREIDRFATVKVRALLTYLAVEGTRPLERTHLADLFWPDRLAESARGSLRHALSNLGKALGNQDAETPYLLQNRHTIQLNPAAIAAGNITIDVARFETLYEQATTDWQAARDAIALYHGPFFHTDLDIDSAEFDQWAQLHRDLLHRKMADLLMLVHARLLDEGDLAQAISYAQQLVEHEPWHEDAHVMLMETLWQDGQVDAAMRQYELCRQALRDELDIDPSPATKSLYEAIRDNRSRFSNVSKRHNIPPRLKPFFGRDQELAEIAQRFAQPNCRQLTVTGPGGMGKSQLVLEYARREMANFADGVWFVSLAGVADGTQIPSTIAECLGIQMLPEQDPLTRLSDFLRNRSLLLILDNFEHLLPGSMLIPQLLSESPQLSILVTSRERLNLQLESVFVLGGLDLPEDTFSDALPAAQARESGAVALFVESAQRSDISFILTDEVKPVVADICHLIEGMPLGIELAAVWTRLLSCQEILENLRRSIDLLTVSMPDIPARHRSMKALIEESWKNLSAEAQHAFARISIFRGGCDWPALQEVVDATMFVVAELLDRGFLRRLEDGSYQIHELMRQFGAEQLAQNPTSAIQIGQRHAQYYLAFLGDRQEDLISSQQVKAIATISARIENIRVAWAWALENKSTELIDRAAEALFKFYDSRGQAHAGEALFAQAGEWLALDANPPVSLVVRIRNYQAAFLEPIRRGQEGRELLAKNVALSREHNLTNALGWALLRLAASVAWSDVEQAIPMLEESRKLFEQTEDTEGVIAVLANQWNFVQIRQVDRGPALAGAEEALDWARTLDAPLLLAQCLARLGTLHDVHGEYDQARALVMEALELARQLNNAMLEAELLNNLAVISYNEKDYQRASQLMEACVNCYQEVGLENSVALIAQENLGRLAQRLDDWDAALNHYKQTAIKSQRAKNNFMLARCNQGLAEVWVQRGDFRQARHSLRIAREIRDFWKLPEMRALVLNNLIQILMIEESYEAAVQVLACKSRQVLLYKPATFDDDEVRETLCGKLGEERFEAILDEASHLEIDLLVDSLL